MYRNKLTYNIIGKVRSPHKSIEGIPIQPVAAKGIKAEIEILE